MKGGDGGDVVGRVSRKSLGFPAWVGVGLWTGESPVSPTVGKERTI